MSTTRLLLVLVPLLALGCVRGTNDTTRADPAVDTSLVSKPLRQLDSKTAAAACVETARELVKADREPEAIEQYERARRHQPDHPGVARELAVLYDRQGRDELAVREYDRALAEEGRSAELLNDLGYFHLQRGRLDEAERVLREAVRANPRLERGSMNLGLVLAEQQRYDEARAEFTKVVSAAAAEHNVGLAMARRGDYASARAAFARAAELDPGLQAPRELLAQLPTENRQRIRLASFENESDD